MTSALNRLGHPALMAGARASLAAGANLSPVRNQAAQHVHVLVINRLVLLGAELADADTAGSAASTIFALVVPAFVISAARAAVTIKGTFHGLLSHPGANHSCVTAHHYRFGSVGAHVVRSAL